MIIAIIIKSAFEFIFSLLRYFNWFLLFIRQYFIVLLISNGYYFIYNISMNFECREELALKRLMPNADTTKNMSTFFYAFSDDTRLKIIILLSIKALCVGDIVAVLDQNQTTISHQLKILRSLNIVECTRQGKNILYYIKNQNIEQVLNAGVDCI